MRSLAALIVSLSLAACGGDGGGNATPPTPSPAPSPTASGTGQPAAGGAVCDYLRDEVVPNVTNAEARVDLNEVYNALGQVQIELQEMGTALLDRGRTEPFGRAVLEVNASVTKVRIGITTGDPMQITVFADEVRRDLGREEIVDRCGAIPTGEA